MKTTIVYGPQGCGKTRHAAQLCQRLGCRSVVDDWLPGEPLHRGALHLTHHEPPFNEDPGVRVLAFADLELAP